MEMERANESHFEERLRERRERLAAAVDAGDDSGELTRLLDEVDAALKRLSLGEFGLCEVCHEPIEPDILQGDPLIRACLDHMRPRQRRALEQDLELASAIQNRMLPERSLRLGGWELAYHYRPAGLVSGDYCDVVDLGEDDAILLVGDVSGKGVAASMLMTHLHALFHGLSAGGYSVEGLVAHANRLFCESTLSAHYATLVCLRADRSEALEICNAGHCRPLVLSRDGSEQVPSTGPPIGLFCTLEFGSRRVAVRPGESLLLYTDGLSEARNPSHEEYGVSRLEAVAANHRSADPAGLLSACMDDVDRFRDGVPLEDDLTLVVLRRADGGRH